MAAAGKNSKTNILQGTYAGFEVEDSIVTHFYAMLEDYEIDVEQEDSRQYTITVTSADGDEYKYTLYLFKDGRTAIDEDTDEMVEGLPNTDMLLNTMRSVIKKVSEDATEYLQNFKAEGGGRRRKTRKSGRKHAKKTHKRGRKHAKKTHKRRH